MESTLHAQWSLQGQQPLLPTESRRNRVHLGGWLNPLENTVNVRQIKRGNTENFIKILPEIEQQYPDKEKITIILDNASWHHSNRVETYLQEHPKLQFWFLPKYSPKLNAQEIQWQYLRQKSTHCRRFEDEVECWQTIKLHFDQLTSERIKSLCQYN